MSTKFINITMKIIVIIAMIIGVIFAFGIFFNKQEASSDTDKNLEEIKYLDTKIISLLNNLNNIQLQNYKITLTKVQATDGKTSNSSKEKQESSEKEDSSKGGNNKEETEISKMEEETIVTEEGQVDWKTMEGEVEILYSTWPTIVLDLYKVNVSSEDILDFSSTIDDVILSIKKEDKTLTAMYLAKLYGYLPKFLDKNMRDEIKVSTLNAKMYIINAYAFAESR